MMAVETTNGQIPSFLEDPMVTRAVNGLPWLLLCVCCACGGVRVAPPAGAKSMFVFRESPNVLDAAAEDKSLSGSERTPAFLRSKAEAFWQKIANTHSGPDSISYPSPHGKQLRWRFNLHHAVRSNSVGLEQDDRR